MALSFCQYIAGREILADCASRLIRTVERKETPAFEAAIGVHGRHPKPAHCVVLGVVHFIVLPFHFKNEVKGIFPAAPVVYNDDEIGTVTVFLASVFARHLETEMIVLT